MVRVQRQREILYLNRRMSGLRSVFQALPVRVFYQTGVKLKSNFHMFMPIFQKSRNPNLNYRDVSILIEKGTVQPLPHIAKPPILGNESVQIDVNNVVNADEVTNTNKKAKTKKKNLQNKEGFGEKLLCHNCSKTVSEEDLSDSVENDESDNAEMNDGDGSKKTLEDKSDEFALKDTEPNKEQADKIEKPISDPRSKNTVDKDSLVTSMLKNPEPVNIEEYEHLSSPLVKKKKLTKKHTFNIQK